MSIVRKWLARQMVRAAVRLDGEMPVGVPQSGGGWQIRLGGMPLGDVTYTISDTQVWR